MLEVILVLIVLVNTYNFFQIRKFIKSNLSSEIESLNEDSVLFLIRINAIQSAIKKLDSENKTLKAIYKEYLLK